MSSLYTDEPKSIRYLLVTLISLVIIIAAIWLYQLPTTGKLRSEVASLKQANAELLSQNKALKQQQQRLSKQLQDHVQASAIQNITDKQLQLRLDTLQNEVIDLNRELDFYQHITQGSTSTKLQVRELLLTADDKHTNLFNYRLVITQGKKISQPITGTINLILTGQKGKTQQSIAISEHMLKLRHVQVFEGQIHLVEGIQPKTVKITLKQNNKITLSKDFDWHITTSPTQTER